MRKRWFLYGLKFVVLAVVVAAALGAVIMALWNALLPELFGWHTIGFWQALGLLLLSKILLSGWRGGGGYRRHWRARMTERWEQMTDEERAQFRTGMRRRCGGDESGSTPDAEVKV